MVFRVACTGLWCPYLFSYLFKLAFCAFLSIPPLLRLPPSNSAPKFEQEALTTSTVRDEGPHQEDSTVCRRPPYPIPRVVVNVISFAAYAILEHLAGKDEACRLVHLLFSSLVFFFFLLLVLVSL